MWFELQVGTPWTGLSASRPETGHAITRDRRRGNGISRIAGADIPDSLTRCGDSGPVRTATSPSSHQLFDGRGAAGSLSELPARTVKPETGERRADQRSLLRRARSQQWVTESLRFNDSIGFRSTDHARDSTSKSVTDSDITHNQSPRFPQTGPDPPLSRLTPRPACSPL